MISKEANKLKEILENVSIQLEEKKIPIPKSPELQLKSKIASIMRSIENLSQKKGRIEYELKRQKQSLERKRLELKKTKSVSTSKFALSLEQYSDFPVEEIERIIKAYDQRLLAESARILDKD
jgi:t-SNARE complex subunit (syntaxin)